MSDSVSEALRANYSPLGSALIEQLYSENYLSLSGEAATDVLADRAGIGSATQVLDIGCGLGGPAMRLAGTRGCRVTGVDLVESNVATARERVKAAGLAERVSIEQGDATVLRFADASFDVVCSQDALCHVPDKAAVLAEIARVARTPAAVAFTDWVEVGAMQGDYRVEVLDALSAPNLQTLSGYCDLLEQHGFEVTVREDISDGFAARYDVIMTRLAALEQEISSRFSPRVFAVMMQKNGALQHAFANGKLGGCMVVARRS